MSWWNDKLLNVGEHLNSWDVMQNSLGLLLAQMFHTILRLCTCTIHDRHVVTCRTGIVIFTTVDN